MQAVCVCVCVFVCLSVSMCVYPNGQKLLILYRMPFNWIVYFSFSKFVTTKSLSLKLCYYWKSSNLLSPSFVNTNNFCDIIKRASQKSRSPSDVDSSINDRLPKKKFPKQSANLVCECLLIDIFVAFALNRTKQHKLLESLLLLLLLVIFRATVPRANHVMMPLCDSFASLWGFWAMVFPSTAPECDSVVNNCCTEYFTCCFVCFLSLSSRWLLEYFHQWSCCFLHCYGTRVLPVCCLVREYFFVPAQMSRARLYSCCEWNMWGEIFRMENNSRSISLSLYVADDDVLYKFLLYIWISAHALTSTTRARKYSFIYMVRLCVCVCVCV